MSSPARCMAPQFSPSGCWPDRSSARMRDLQKARDVEVALEMRGERVECRLDPRLITESGIAYAAKPGNENAAERIAGEEPVQIAAGNATIDRASTARALGIGAIAEAQHRA